MAQIVSKSTIYSRINQKPINYAMCTNPHCSLAATCRHALEATEDARNASVLHIINPLEYAGRTDGCPQYRNVDSTSSYAIGFTSLSNRIKDAGLLSRFKAECLKHFSRTTFYELRAGNRELSPETQNIIKECAHRAGYTFDDDAFDEYVVGTCW